MYDIRFIKKSGTVLLAHFVLQKGRGTVLLYGIRFRLSASGWEPGVDTSQRFFPE